MKQHYDHCMPEEKNSWIGDMKKGGVIISITPPILLVIFPTYTTVSYTTASKGLRTL